MSTLTHLDWKFDYIPNKCIYDVNFDTITDEYFKLASDVPFDGGLYDDFRKGAIMHKIIRTKLSELLVDNMSYLELATKADDLLKSFKKENQFLEFAFPLGISVNEIVAHDTANINDTRTIKTEDVVKLDLGICLNGSIIDSAFTKIVGVTDNKDNKLQPLLDAAMDATYTGISLSGVDASLYDISVAIQEVIESYEINDGKQTQIKAVTGLGGHNILPYKVHGKKLILSVPHPCQNYMRMDENEIYAIETYASTGFGKITQGSLNNCNHFEINDEMEFNHQTNKNKMVKLVGKYQGLPFTQRYFQNEINMKIEKDFKNAIQKKMIIAYPPISEKKGIYTSQFEHTIRVGNKRVEIFSLGMDY